MKDTTVETTDEKTMLDVDYSDGFSVECFNLLDNPKAMHFPGFSKMCVSPHTDESGNLTEDVVDISRTKDSSTTMLICLRYYEYLCVATVKFWYLKDILRGGLNILESFDMFKHHLRNKLVREVRGTEAITEFAITYFGMVKY